MYETKGFADAFLRKCVNLKSLGGILASIKAFEPSAVSLAALSASGTSSEEPNLAAPGDYYKSTYTTIANDCQGLILGHLCKKRATVTQTRARLGCVSWIPLTNELLDVLSGSPFRGLEPRLRIVSEWPTTRPVGGKSEADSICYQRHCGD